MDQGRFGFEQVGIQREVEREKEIGGGRERRREREGGGVVG